MSVESLHALSCAPSCGIRDDEQRAGAISPGRCESMAQVLKRDVRRDPAVGEGLPDHVHGANKRAHRCADTRSISGAARQERGLQELVCPLDNAFGLRFKGFQLHDLRR
jgi:hypothetical protein